MSVFAMAQTDSTKTPPATTFSGSVDVYYRYNFNAPGGGTDPKSTNNYTSFTNSQSSFELGMASIRADHSWGKVSATADLGFGRRAEEFSYNDAGIMAAIKQVYLTYAPTDKVKFTMGKWGTHVGYEVLDAFANRNYSMDYMFTNGPFFHTGLKADITVSGTTAFMVGVANPHDYTTTVSPVKEALAQFSTGTKNGKLKLFLNYMGYGGAKESMPTASSLSQFDVVVNGIISDKFGIGYNGTIQSVKDETVDKTKKWWGSALYFNYDPISSFGLTLRGEYFDDKDGLKLPVMVNSDESTSGSSVFDLTLSGNIKIKSLTIIPEIRLDNSNHDAMFVKSDGTATKSTFSALLAAVYKF
jgi:hypothetical protein